MRGSGRPAMDGYERAFCRHPQRREFSADAGHLAQKASAHLLAAGLELHSALPLIGESKTTDRCAGALGNIDEAIKVIRQLAVAAGWAIPEPRAGEGPGNAAKARVRATPGRGAGVAKTDVTDPRARGGRARTLQPAVGVRARPGGGVTWGRF
jgi:hypothetical protein